MALAQRPNQFLTTIFEDRELYLEMAVATYSTTDLSNTIIGLEAVAERQKNEKFKNLLDIVVSCVALKRSCGMGVGKWLNDHSHITEEKICARITEKCKLSATIFREWNTIVHNLTNSEMVGLDPRDFTLRKLYEARKFTWCLKELAQNEGKSSAKHAEERKEYSEPLYRDIIQNVRNSGILQGVSFDPVQAELIGNRIKDDLKKMCKNATQ